jgi:hypothetical protein
MPMPMVGTGPSSLMSSASIADQVSGETEAERRKRLAGMKASQQLPNGMSSLAEGYGSALGMS